MEQQQRKNCDDTIWRRAFAVVAAGLVVATAGAGVAGADDEQQVPVSCTDSADAIQDQYIVVMRPGAQAAANRVAAVLEARRNGAEVSYEYGTALHGFAARLPARALDLLRRNPAVEYIEADQTMRLSATQSPATWRLDRIDQRNLPLSNSYTYNFTGAGITAYVIDTGIRFSHNEFGGRAVSGFDSINGGSADDCNGHGTHVAGTTGGTRYGVAKSVRVVGVRVPELPRHRQQLSGDRWGRLGHQRPRRRPARRGQHEPWRPPVERPGHRDSQLHRRRDHLCAGGRELQSQRLQHLPGPGRRGDHGGLHDQNRCPVVVLELRDLPGHLRPRLVDHLGLEHQQ